MLQKLDLADKCTWFIPGHSVESFPDEVRQVVDAGCEIGLHGYAHEGAYQLTPEQERDVLVKCIDISTKLTGKRPVGYRAPLYQLRESTLDLLEEFGFEYGTFVLTRPSSSDTANNNNNRRFPNRSRLSSLLRAAQTTHPTHRLQPPRFILDASRPLGYPR